jgi:hypothetical protein
MKNVEGNPPSWWKAFLLDHYMRCREFPGWGVIFEMHDQDDRDYFNMLDLHRSKKKIECVRYVSDEEIREIEIRHYGVNGFSSVKKAVDNDVSHNAII